MSVLTLLRLCLSVLTTFAAVGIFSPCRMGCHVIGSYVCPLDGLSHANVCCRRPVAFWTGLSHGRLVGSDGMVTLLDGLLHDHQSAPLVVPVPFPCRRRPCFWKCWMPPCQDTASHPIQALCQGEGRSAATGHVIFISSLLIWCARPAAHEARDIPLRMPDRHARSRLGLPAAIPLGLDAAGGVCHGACRRVDAGGSRDGMRGHRGDWAVAA